MLRKMAAVLLMSCSLLACGDTARVAQAIPTPPERLVCEAVPQRPSLPAEYAIDWRPAESAPDARTAVALLRAEFGKFVGALRTREGIVAGHILNVEGRLFVCFNNMQWRREFEAELARDGLASGG